MSTILTIDELAAWLRISKRAVYELTSERGRARTKRIPCRCCVSVGQFVS